MKRQLSPTVIAAVLGVIVLIVVVVGFMQLGSGFGPAPTVEPKPFTPPAGYQPGGMGGPMGAPKTSSGTQEDK